MNGQTRIERLAGRPDLDGVMAIDRESFAVPWTRQMYEGELAEPEAAVILVCRTADWPVAGYCSYRVAFDELHINNVAVRPQARRLGLGRALVCAAVDDARRRGLVRVLLEVRSGNQAARKLYEGLGFTRIGLRRGYYAEPPDDALVLARDLRNFGSDPDA